MQMIKGAEEQGKVESLVFQKVKVAGISLPGFYIFVLGAENFQVVGNQLYGCDIVAPVTEFYGVAAGACTDVGDFEFLCHAELVSASIDSLFDVVHSCTEFYLSVAGCEAVFFVEFVVVFV